MKGAVSLIDRGSRGESGFYSVVQQSVINKFTFPMSDIIRNKCESIERSLRRIEDIQATLKTDLSEDLLRQDALVLNLERACQASIDLAMHLVKIHKLGQPKNSREAFALLEEKLNLDPELSHKLQKMVGFRNVAIHDYQSLDVRILEAILKTELITLKQFGQFALRLT